MTRRWCASPTAPVAGTERLRAGSLTILVLTLLQIYLGALVARHTGMPARDAEQRVVQTFARMKAGLRSAATSAKLAADDARKASAWAALWLSFFSPMTIEIQNFICLLSKWEPIQEMIEEVIPLRGICHLCIHQQNI